MPPFADHVRSRRHLLFLALGALAILLAIGGFLALQNRGNPLLETPELALVSLEAKSLYFNGRARPWLLARRPDLLLPEDHEASSVRSRALVQAVQDPALFRKLDREYRFDTLLLTGDASEYKPLLDHLVVTKDWSLNYADHTSLVFRRNGGKAWRIEDFDAVCTHFSQMRKRDQAMVRAQTGIRLLAAGQREAAKRLLDEAAQLDPQDSGTANGLAVYHLTRGEWREATVQVERALAADASHLPALATKTQLLYGMKRFGEAFEVSRRVLARVPEDPGMLFYHAKIAHEAHAYKAEIEALEKLIAQATASERPAGGYRIYLGQAYAALGDAPRAIEAFMLALNDPGLPDEQRSFARENIARIKKRTGLQADGPDR